MLATNCCPSKEGIKRFWAIKKSIKIVRQYFCPLKTLSVDHIVIVSFNCQKMRQVFWIVAVTACQKLLHFKAVMKSVESCDLLHTMYRESHGHNIWYGHTYNFIWP